MKNIYWGLLAATLLLFISCAKKPEVDYAKLSEISFEAWMEAYGGDAEKLPSGVYVKKLQESTLTSPVAVTSNKWIMIDYTGRTLGNNKVYVTRYKEEAELQGTFSYFTHYTPQFVELTQTNPLLIEGQYFAMQEMKEGEKWRVYIPSHLAFKSDQVSFGFGYQGQYTLSADIPVIMDIEIKEVISNPEAYESELVRTYATTELGLNFNETIDTDVYLKNVSYWRDGMPGVGDIKIKEDSTATIYYVGRFLDGQVFDTNIVDTALHYKIYISPDQDDATNLYDYYSSYYYNYYGGYYDIEDYYNYNYYYGYDYGTEETEERYGAKNVKLADNTFLDGINTALKNMHYGEVARTVFTSNNGYGDIGSSEGNTVIQAYTPLIYDLYVGPIGGSGSKLFPYTVPGIQSVPEGITETERWVTGCIVGICISDINNCQFDGSFGNRGNLLLGVSTGSNNHTMVIPIELPDGSELQKVWNLQDNKATMMHQYVAVYGDIGPYLATTGVTNISTYYTLDSDSE